MSNRKRKALDLTNNLDGPAPKKRKLSTKELLILDVRRICRSRRCTTTIECVQTVLNNLSNLSVQDRQTIIENAKKSDCDHYLIAKLLQMNIGLSSSASSYSFLSAITRANSNQHLTKLSTQNKIKTNIMKKFANPSKRGEKYRPYILTIQLGEKESRVYRPRHMYLYSTTRSTSSELKYTAQYYDGAIESLQNFTADLFLNTFKEFNFFRFQKIVNIKKIESRYYVEYTTEYTECGTNQVLKLLQSMKNDKKSQTFLLLMFFMTTYFKTFVFSAIKCALHNSTISDICNINTELNDDVLSVIMSFMMTNHSSISEIFEDKLLVKQLMKEVANADQGWQDIFVDIIENDSEYADLYQPQMRIYYDSERLNLLNMELYGKMFTTEKMKKWLQYSVEYDHYKIYEIILKEHCRLKICDFKHIFYQISFQDIKDKNKKWFICIENKSNQLKEILNKKQCKKFEKLCDDWKEGIST